jgi:hypothetical protein
MPNLLKQNCPAQMQAVRTRVVADYTLSGVVHREPQPSDGLRNTTGHETMCA